MSDSSPSPKEGHAKPSADAFRGSATLGDQLGRYRLVARLGQGGMGTIHLAVAAGLGDFRKPLVIKELKPELTRDSSFMRMFLSEAKLAAQLSHPNVVHTIEASQDRGRYFLVMEFLDGQPLSEVMRAADYDPRLSPGLRLHVLCEALSGLHYAHELRDYEGMHLSVVHRDVSPHNVFVTYDGQVKVVDFGIAKVSDVESATVPGVFKGRFAYAAPEQVRGQPVDRRADIFSVGVMLWEAVSMRRFARGKPTQAMVTARISGTEPKLCDVEPDVDPVLSQICERAMHVDPNRRFPTAEAFRLALQQYLMVSGKELDTARVSEAMRTVFATQREAMHKLIAPQLSDASVGADSMVRPLLSVSPPPDESVSSPPALGNGSDDPDEPEEITAVTDLRALVEATRTDLPVARDGLEDDLGDDLGTAERKRRLALGLGGAAVLAVVVYVSTLGGSAEPEQDVSAASQPASGESVTSQPATGESVTRQPVATPAPAAAPAQPPPPAAPSSAAPTRAVPAEVAPVRGLRELTRARDRDADRERSVDRRVDGRPSRQGRSAAPPQLPASANVERARRGRLRVEGTRAGTDGQGGFSPGVSNGKPAPGSAGAKRVSPVVVGEDLRAIKKRERRSLDLEDPFQ